MDPEISGWLNGFNTSSITQSNMSSENAQKSQAIFDKRSSNKTDQSQKVSIEDTHYISVLHNQYLKFGDKFDQEEASKYVVKKVNNGH